MNINGSTIITPHEDPVGFQLDWRARIAGLCFKEGLAAADLPWVILKDDLLKQLVSHLRYRVERPLKAIGVLRPCDRVDQWHASETGRLIEAYLLTPAPFAHIAAALGLPEAEIKLYERLRYSVRDDQGNLVKGILARLKAEIHVGKEHADLLKRTAILGGVPGLECVLGSGDDSTEDLGRLVDQELRRRLVAGQLRTNDLIGLQRNAAIRERIMADRQANEPKDDPWMKVVQPILALMAPKMIEVEHTKAELEAKDKEISGRIASQRLAHATAPVDVTVTAEAGLDALIKKRLSG